MPLAATTLHRELVRMGEFVTGAEAAIGWADAYATYASAATQMAAAPHVAGTVATSTITPELAFVATDFYGALEDALVAFWPVALPLGFPGSKLIIAPSGLARALVGPSAAALAAPTDTAALLPIAEAIHAWTLTVSGQTAGDTPFTVT